MTDSVGGGYLFSGGKERIVLTLMTLVEKLNGGYPGERTQRLVQRIGVILHLIKQRPLRVPIIGMRSGGIFPAILGTIVLTFGAFFFATPLGIGAAIYLSEYSKDNKWTRMIRLAIINLAGIPSVVYGLFGLGLFVLSLQFGTSILASSLTLAIMTMPVVISTTEEALLAVPQSFRAVSISLGATRWQTI